MQYLENLTEYLHTFTHIHKALNINYFENLSRLLLLLLAREERNFVCDKLNGFTPQPGFHDILDNFLNYYYLKKKFIWKI